MLGECCNALLGVFDKTGVDRGAQYGAIGSNSLKLALWIATLTNGNTMAIVNREI